MGILNERKESSLTVKEAIKDLVNCYKIKDLELNELYKFNQGYMKEFKPKNPLVKYIILKSFLEYVKYKRIKKWK